jgi:hypothetical protein
MKLMHFLACLFVSVLLSACAAFQGAGDIAQGRQALFEGNNQAALGYFQAAEQVDPNYIYGTELQEGVLSYLGRAQYLTGDYAQARPTLEKGSLRTKTTVSRGCTSALRWLAKARPGRVCKISTRA